MTERAELEKIAREISRQLVLSPGARPLGFALLVFDFEAGGNLAWVSNAERESMMEAMKEFIEKNGGTRASRDVEDLPEAKDASSFTAGNGPSEEPPEPPPAGGLLTGRLGRAGGYNHVEAYCLMKYRCTYCGMTERLWNSRDGATLFAIKCTRCGRLDMIHVDWPEDERRPNYLPRRGERVFIDLTPQMAELLARVRVRKEWDMSESLMKERFSSRDEAVKQLSLIPHPGEPYVLTL